MSKLEDDLAFQLKVAKVKAPQREYRFHCSRRWKADFAWPAEKLIVEVEGGVYSNGRHVRPLGFTKDCEKYNRATLIGFRVLRVTSEHIKKGIALGWIEEALSQY
jgi:very-short-patch-repair endonuclease